MIPGKSFGRGFDRVLFVVGIVQGLTVRHLESMQVGCSDNFERKSTESTKRVVFGLLVSSEHDHLTVKPITGRPHDTAPCMAAPKRHCGCIADSADVNENRACSISGVQFPWRPVIQWRSSSTFFSEIKFLQSVFFPQCVQRWCSRNQNYTTNFRFRAFNIDRRFCYPTASRSGIWKFAFHMDLIKKSKMWKISSNFSGLVFFSFLVLMDSCRNPAAFGELWNRRRISFRRYLHQRPPWSQHVTCCDRVLIGLDWLGRESSMNF